jgi:2-polyprenyl-6-methoxyphenol hydroxylase-like FAD-dependent oxidoreductase
MMDATRRKRAAVCGAGIAGLATAAVLARGGWEVVVVERAPRLRDAGYMIDFFGPGFETAERLGLLPALERVRYRIQAIRWADRNGRTQTTTHYDVFEHILRGRLMSLMRGDLEREIHDVLPASVDMRFGRTVQAFEERGDRLAIDLGGGMFESADVLIGADGVHSRVRELAFGPESGFIRDLGYRTAAYVFADARVHAALGNEFVIASAPNRQAGLYPLRDGRVATFFAHRGREPLPESPAAALRSVYGDLGGLVPDALAAAAGAESIYYDMVAQVEMPAWSRGRVALVGDAAQAVSLLAGQGASIAMAAGEALGNALASSASPAAAFARYEAEMRPMVEKRQAAGRRIAKWFVPADRVRLAIRNAALRVIELPGFEWLARRFFVSD